QAGHRAGDSGRPGGPRSLPRPDLRQVRCEDEVRVRDVGRDEQLREQAPQGRQGVGELVPRADCSGLELERLNPSQDGDGTAETRSPPIHVDAICLCAIRSGVSNGSPRRTTKSASFPGSRVPSSCSSNAANAPPAVAARIASSGERRWSSKNPFTAQCTPKRGPYGMPSEPKQS